MLYQKVRLAPNSRSLELQIFHLFVKFDSPIPRFLEFWSLGGEDYQANGVQHLAENLDGEMKLNEMLERSLHLVRDICK